MRSSDVDSAATFPLTNVVVLSLGTGLIPEDTSERWPLRGTLLAGMRAHIERVYGIRIPGVSIQQNADLAATGFEIRLDGIVVRSGEVPDRRFVSRGTFSPGRRGGLAPECPRRQPRPPARAGRPHHLGRVFADRRARGWRGAGSPRRRGNAPEGSARTAAAAAREGAGDRSAGRTRGHGCGGDRRGRHPHRSGFCSFQPWRRPCPGAEPGTRLEPLPQELESAVAEHIRADHPPGTGGPAWQAPRAAADRLVGQLREHLSSLSADTAVSVRDPDVRSSWYGFCPVRCFAAQCSRTLSGKPQLIRGPMPWARVLRSRQDDQADPAHHAALVARSDPAAGSGGGRVHPGASRTEAQVG